MAQVMVPVEGYGGAVLEDHPDRCPICHSNITPNPLLARTGGHFYGAKIQIVYRCPNRKCEELFISYFFMRNSTLFPSTSRPVEPRPRIFAQSIEKLSASFCEIYNQAHKAEELDLLQICGVGYRKSLEFLVKDYLISGAPEEKSNIEKTFLGPCIEKYVRDQNIKSVAKRATWLGNDEAHYQRRWIEKDLNDLKMLIDLVIHWIQAEHLTNEILESMPDKV